MMKFIAAAKKTKIVGDEVKNKEVKKTTPKTSKTSDLPIKPKMSQKIVDEPAEEFMENSEEEFDEDLAEDTEQELVGDDTEISEDEDLGFDLFELKTGGVFTKEEVIKIELPKFVIKTDFKDINVVEDKSTIVLTLMSNETNHSVGKRIFNAIKNGFKEFKIEFFDLEEKVESVWEFTNAKIKIVDFGNVENSERVDGPRTIMCEVEYANLVIDKVSLI